MLQRYHKYNIKFKQLIQKNEKGNMKHTSHQIEIAIYSI